MRSTRTIAFVPLTLLALFVSGCANQSGSSLTASGSTSTNNEAAADGLAALAGAVNAGATGSGAITSAAPPRRFLEKLLPFPSAYATVTTCGSPVANDTCSSGAKSASYTACAISGSSQTYTGTVALAYSSTTCSLSSLNATVTRSLNVTRSGIFDTNVTTDSNPVTDYRGTVASGGVRLKVTNTATPTFQLDVLGIHKVRKSGSGATLQDVSIQTTAPFTVTGALAGGNRTVSGGTLVVAHNLARYVATFTISDSLTFSDAGTCCHPTSGTVSVTYSGAQTGTGTLQYSSTCGQATLSLNGNTTVLTLHGCE